MRTRTGDVARVDRTPVAQRLYDYPRVVALVRSAVNLVVPDHLVQVHVAHGPLRGVRLALNLRREKAFWFGIYEPWVQKLVWEVLGAGGRAWDVGACFGYHTLLMCKLCGAKNVVAIEPDPNNLLRLAGNLRRNNFRSASIVSAAVGASPGTLFLRRHWDDPGQSVVESSGEIEVEVTTLDILLHENAPPDLIKVDIEGAEDLMLLGANRLLKEVRPAWILELHGERGQGAVELLRSHGYDCRAFGKGHEFPADFPVGGPSHVFAEPWR